MVDIKIDTILFKKKKSLLHTKSEIHNIIMYTMKNH